MEPEQWKEVERLYQAALDQPADRRAAFLEEACDSDEELRREVESLLARHSDADGFIEEPALEAAARDLADEADFLMGQQIASYCIVELLGAGGMGQVYLADDSNLNRRVALKFLPPHLQEHERARRRFQREARSAAAIDHPYICSIYEVGTADGRDFIAMEHVEGQTLADKLSEGPLPIQEALTTALEIAEAVEAAHDAGIVHRDLKPSNVMLTAAGHAKVMDFGLAKRLTPAEAADSDSPDDLTVEGTTPGTIAYMSPEQLKGARVDARSDVFSFGVMLFEMLAGIHPFRKGASVETTSAILKEPPPPLARFLPEASDAIGHVVRKMLAKEPGLRHQSMHEVRTELQQLLEDPERLVGAAPARYLSWPVLLPWTMATLAVAALLSGVYVPSENTDAPVVRSRIPLPPGQRLTHWSSQAISLSPDGRHLAFVAGTTSDIRVRPTTQIYVRSLDQWQSRPVPGTEGGVGPVFSPDGSVLAFYDAETYYIKTVRLDGGDVKTLCECPARLGITWQSDRFIIGTDEGPLFRVSTAGGTPEILTRLQPGEFDHRLPQVVLGTDLVFFTAVRRHFSIVPTSSRVVVQSLRTGEQTPLIEDALDARYVPSGHLVFVRRGTLMAVGFDIERLKVVSAPVPIVEGINHSIYLRNSRKNTGAAQYSFSQTGTFAFALGSTAPESPHTVVGVDRNGVEEVPELERPRQFIAVRVSPDGRRLLLKTSYPPMDVWLYDLDEKTIRPLTFQGTVLAALWGPGPDQFTFQSFQDGAARIYIKDVDSGPGIATEISTGYNGRHEFGDWSPDGKEFVFVVDGAPNARDPNTNNKDIWIWPRGGKAYPFLTTEFVERHPDFSHDGRWLAYTSNQSGYESNRPGRRQVWAIRFPDKGRPVLLTPQTGHDPAWAHDSREVFFRGPNRRESNDRAGTRAATWVRDILSVSVDPSHPGLNPGKPTTLFGGNWVVGTGRFWDVDANGRFWLLEFPGDDFRKANADKYFPTEIHLVQNFFDELRRQVPLEN